MWVWVTEITSLLSFSYVISERGEFLENFTYTDKEMADIFEETFYNTSFLGVTVFIMFIGKLVTQLATYVALN